VRAPALAAAVLLGGCGVNNPTYFPSAAPMEAGGMGMGDATATVTLPFRPPGAADMQALDDASSARGYRIPWLARDQVALSLSYTITNLDGDEGTAQLLINGASELASYDRGAIIAAQMAAAVRNNDAADVLSLIEVTPVAVKPGQSHSGLVREDDFAEAELDLDAIGRWMAPPAAVLINASEVNPVGLENVPPGVVVPALFRITITFTATAHMRLDYLVRVRDKDGQLLGSAGGDAFAPNPPAYVPPVMAAP
jgi:hypothetical protein